MSELLKKYKAYYKREISTEEFEQCNTLAYREYFRSTQIAEKWNESNMILFDLYQKGYQDIVDCVKELGFKGFYITDGFSSLIERLGTLPDYCTINGVHKICIGTGYDWEQNKEIPEYGFALYVAIEE